MSSFSSGASRVNPSVNTSVNTHVSINDIIAQTTKAKTVTGQKVRDIRQVTAKLKILALNALIEAKHAGDKGLGFSVVADEVRNISGEVESLAKDLGDEIVTLESLTLTMAQQSKGTRLTDLALNAVELIDRNLYERTCDVRWWATDAALVTAASEPDIKNADHACARLGVILDSYTVYIDLWLCDLAGNVIANGRPDKHSVIGNNVHDRLWFTRAMNLKSGSDFAVADITTEPLLGHEQVATYATGVRRNGDANGELIGILGIHFDWAPQAASITHGIRISPDEKAQTRVMLVDAQGLIIASSDDKGILSEHIRLRTEGRTSGHYMDSSGHMVAYHRTPGYETYQGLGWYGIIIQKPD
ncbi:MAG: methyl-accepting chemotaxis protein [Asticcacaulis sp.]